MANDFHIIAKKTLIHPCNIHPECSIQGEPLSLVCHMPGKMELQLSEFIAGW